ncbi:MAG: penicillin-binding protein 2 [Candidatus Omnitrophota bacterium]
MRIRLLRGLIYVCFIILAMGLFYFQVLRSGYYKGLSLRNTIRIVPIEASRGSIFDRNKKPIAIDEISFNLVIIPQEVEDIDSTLKLISKVTGEELSELTKNYKRNYYVPFVPVNILTNLEKEKAFYIEEKLSSIPGALLSTEPRRYYANGKIGSHIVGYVGRIERSEYKTLRDYGYKIQDLVGKSGIEKYYDAYLKGDDGGIQVEVNAASRIMRRLSFKEPAKGKDLTLTIDSGLQSFTDGLMEGRIGSCILMDVGTGEILALVSSPEFNPNVFTRGSSKEKTAILTDKRCSLLNRAASCKYPPGSIFKIVVASAGLAAGTIKRDTTFDCSGEYRLGGIRFGCWKESGHGPQNVVEALTHSCNVFFYNLGDLLGAEGIYRYALQFGLDSATGIDLPGEVKGLVPNTLWKRFFIKEPWYRGDTINYSIGQGYLLVTPIEMLRAVTIVANEGYSPAPHLVKEIEGRKISYRKRHIAKIPESVLKIIKKGLSDVVNSKTGTGLYAKHDSVKIAGKTGTAQPGTAGDTHAWFVGYLPADNPKISFCIFLEHGGQGGKDPAHMARILTTYLDTNGFL